MDDVNFQKGKMCCYKPLFHDDVEEEPKKVCNVIITYTFNSWFELPAGIKLLSVAENKLAKNGTPFSWYIIYDTLHWFDESGKEDTVKGSATGFNGFNFKRYDEDTERIEYEDADE
jgi:hypothetical protein